jgi:phage shock protein C
MIGKTIQKILLYFEFQSFGVCKAWGRELGIESSRVRIAFIYTSFFTLGSPLILYFALYWLMENKHYFKLERKRKKTIWEL